MNHALTDFERQSLRKQGKGAALLARKQARADIDRFEHEQKEIVRKRDKGCRWPRCTCKRLKLRLEVAHLDAKGIGGDHGQRSTADQMILLCFVKHQGNPSLHSGDLKIMPLTAAGTAGPCDFLQRSESGVFEIVATERAIGVSETRGR